MDVTISHGGFILKEARQLMNLLMGPRVNADHVGTPRNHCAI
jgi:hypothetical protein